MLAASYTRAFGFLRSHMLLVIVGLACEFIYLFYFVRQMPLLRYYDRLTEIGIITDHSKSGFITFSLVLIVLFCLLGLAWWDVHRFDDHATLWLILGFGALFAVTMVFVYPATAIDVYTYLADSLVWVQYHANPTVVPPSYYANDPLMRMAGGWAWLTAPYGPLGLLIDMLPPSIAGRNLLADLLLYKCMFSGMLLLEAFLVYKILRQLSPKLAISGALFVAWNPFMLFEYSANGHNDIVMMLFVLLAVLALVKNRLALAVALITASALVKYATVLLIPLFLIYGILQQPTNKQRLQYLALAVTASLGLVVILYAPFWQGFQTLGGTVLQDQRYMSSFSTVLNYLFPNTITLDQGKLPGRIIFVLFYLYALFLSTRRRLSDVILGSFVTLFFLQVFALSNFDIWYAIWPLMLAVLIPRTAVRVAALLFVFGTSLSVTLYYYVWVWLGLQDPRNLATVNALAYLLTFVPALLILLGLVLRRVFNVSWNFRYASRIL